MSQTATPFPPPPMGHNTQTKAPSADERLRSLVSRIERLEEEKKALSSDISDIYKEAKSAGFDVKALRQIIRESKWSTAEIEEHETILDMYRRILGR